MQEHTDKYFSLKKKRVLVTGGATGIGQAIAVAMARLGADVAITSHRSPPDDTLATIKACGGKVLVCECDMEKMDNGSAAALIAKVKAEFDGVDVLVNNAGIIRRAPIFEFSEEYWDDVLQINLKALFFLSQAAARQMAEQGGGKIINIASMLSFQGGILVPSYTAAKSAVAGVTKALANELASKNINVNAIAPGYMATDNTAPLRADAKRNQAILERIPSGRWGDPADLKGIVVFLASAASDYMQGAIVPVDGGWLCR